MKEYPILFSGPMVRAILEGRKTQTRRVIRRQPTEQVYQIYNSANFAPRDPLDQDAPDFAREIRCPYGAPGEHLWVREACAIGWHDTGPLAVDYHADGTRRTFEPDTDQKAQAAAAYIGDSRRPPFLMPMWASRITLEIVGVKVERVQEITLADCKAEGIAPYTFAKGAIAESPPDARWKFIELWDQINASRGYGWAENPWVWAITFRRMSESELP